MTNLPPAEYGRHLASIAEPLTDEQIERAARVYVTIQARVEVAA